MRVQVLYVFIALFSVHLLAVYLVRSLARRFQAGAKPVLLFGLWTFGTLFLLLLAILSPHPWQAELRRWLYPAFSAAMVWNLLFLAPVTLILYLLRLGLALVSWWQRKKKPVASPSEIGLSRRAFLYQLGLGAAPAVALGAGVHGALTQQDLRVREFTVPITGLPPELEGLVLAHVSDLHSGLYCGEERLKKISDLTNDLRPDLILVTGDVINDKATDLPPALAALKRLRSASSSGPLISEGNHDLIPGPDLLGQSCAEAGLLFLRGTEQVITLRGAKIRIAGLPWLNPHDEKELLSSIDPFPQPRTAPELRITLSHHPDLFPQLAGGSDLVLSGHTHGGQLMLGPLGFGPLLFNYWSGLYRAGRSTLIVSNGCGDWFPCRIGAPAEVGRIVLKKAA